MMKPFLLLMALLNPTLAGYSYSASTAGDPGEIRMKGSHVHFGVKDLQGALQWLDRIWQLQPTYQDERMAVLPFGAISIILDRSESDTSATVGFESQNCDDDYRSVKARGAVVLEEPKDRPWGVRSAYIQGPGALKFEIEQVLPRGK